MNVKFVLFVLFFGVPTESRFKSAILKGKLGCHTILSDDTWNGFAPYLQEWVSCPHNVSPSIYAKASCGLRCRDPNTGRLLGLDYQQFPDVICKLFTFRCDGRIVKERIPITRGCICKKTKWFGVTSSPPEC